jgi:L-seryl-tRNA(Ser) seleniumtransferase
VLSSIRATLDQARFAILAGEPTAPDLATLCQRVLDRLNADQPTLRPVLNATGILLHTGLGRAPLAAEAAAAVDRVVRGYCNLEFDLDSGQRGHRTTGVASLLRELTGAEAATVVNNNAAATVLALRALAFGREVVVSRGQLVEIGGSFRLPEIFEASGARLREVGTTNKTRLADYEQAIHSETAALLRVHPSNFRILGFSEQVSIQELAILARQRGLFLIDDIGSGAMAPGLPPGIEGEPSIREGLAAGADLVLCSGDKLLGGPQCGLLVGTAVAIQKVSADPLMRAFRVDKMTLAALEATLRLTIDPDFATRRIPLWSFLNLSLEQLRDRLERMATWCREELSLTVAVEPSSAFLGGGSLPVESIPSLVLRLSPPYAASINSETELARRLRLGQPPVIPRVQAGAVLLDLRTVFEQDDRLLFEVLRGVFA